MRDSLWFMPGVLTATGALLALGLTEIERGFAFEGAVGVWVFSGGAEGARGVLSAIGSSLITVTGVVFSVVIVALQLASSQYTPRLLRDFTADRGNQVVLGVFIGTFTYTLLVLRTVREADEGMAFVPGISVTVAIVLAILNIGVLIFFIDHSARSIQVSTILTRVTRRTLDAIERRFPADIGQPASPPPALPSTREPVVVAADRSGYLQQVDDRGLFDTGRAGDHVIVMETQIGSFVVAGDPLARIHGATLGADAIDDIRSAFVLGSQRTPDQDIEFGIIELSDIAVKALSPGINDPTTALHCIDRIVEVLIFLGSRKEPDLIRSDTGATHFIPRHRSFDALARRAFDPIREFGGGRAVIVRPLLEAFKHARDRLPPARRPVLAALTAELLDTARARIDHDADLRDIERLAAT